MNIPTKPFLILLPLFLGLSAIGQSRSDMLYAKLRQSKPDTNRVRALGNLGVYYINLPDRKPQMIDSSIYLFTQALKLAQQLQAPDHEMKMRSRLATAWFIKGEDQKAMEVDLAVINHYKNQKNLKLQAYFSYSLGFDIQVKTRSDIAEKIKWYNESIRLNKLLNDQASVVRAWTQIAALHIRDGKYDVAEKELQELLNYAKNVGYNKMVPVYEQLASISDTQGDLHKQLAYQLKLIDNMETTGDTANADRHYRRLGENYFQAGMLEEAQQWGERAMRSAIANKDRVYAYSVLDLLVNILIKQKKATDALIMINQLITIFKPVSFDQQITAFQSLALCFSQLRQVDKAEKNYLSADSVFNIQNMDNGSIRSKNFNNILVHELQMATFYYKARKFDRSQAFLQKAEALPQAYLSASGRMAIERMQYKVDSVSGNFESALKHSLRFKSINDSIFDAGKIKQLSDLHVKYETDKKEQEIKTLQAQEKQAVLEKNIKQADLDRVSLQRDLQKGMLTQAALQHRADSQKAASDHNLQQARLQKLNLQRAAELQKASLERAIQRADIQKANTQRDITFGGIAALLIIAGLAFKGYRNKRRSNLVLKAQQGEINEQNDTLQNLVVEKEWLLKEVHHRVKNNLQIIMSLLNSQAAFLENNDAREAIRESQNRVQAISLLHQKLYRSSSLVSINLQNYVADLVLSLKHSFDTEQRGVRLLQKIEPVGLDTSQAVPLGLILNESITNAIKYAFGPDGGEVKITLYTTDSDEIMLEVSDNGKGLPEGFDLQHAGSLGLEMMKALARQLEGKFHICDNGGVRITVCFPNKRLGQYGEATE